MQILIRISTGISCMINIDITLICYEVYKLRKDVHVYHNVGLL